ncbi:MAG: DUF4145 domain-containing protein [Anaerolineae bacterium]|nr:DUF4145 domain-containing protein [Anaerolineae bacterium]
MPLPPEVDNQIRKRFTELESEAKRLVEFHNSSETLLMIDRSANSDYTSDFQRLKTNFLNLIQLLSTKRNSYADLIKDVRAVGSAYPSELQGMIEGLKSDYENGMLRSIAEMIETNVVADYLTQAGQLLKDNKNGVHPYGPAAVLAGAVLEDGLRRLCSRQTPPISTNKPGGHPKTMGTLIDDLKNAGLFNELKAKQLRAWADIRNAAAHGRFEDFTRDDVERLIAGVQSFLADNL